MSDTTGSVAGCSAGVSGLAGCSGAGFSGSPGVGFSGSPGAGFSGSPGVGFSGSPGVGFSGSPGVGFYCSPADVISLPSTTSLTSENVTSALLATYIPTYTYSESTEVNLKSKPPVIVSSLPNVHA